MSLDFPPEPHLYKSALSCVGTWTCYKHLGSGSVILVLEKYFFPVYFVCDLGTGLGLCFCEFVDWKTELYCGAVLVKACEIMLSFQKQSPPSSLPTR